MQSGPWSFVRWLLVFLCACAAEPRPAVPSLERMAGRPVVAEPSNENAPDLGYVVRRVEDAGGRYRLVIEVSFAGHASGRTPLQLPDAWAGEKELYRDIGALEATSARTSLEPGEDAGKRTLVHPPGARVALRYEIRQTDELERIEHDRAYRLLAQKDYFHTIGYAMWVTPAWKDDEPRSIRIRWEGFPKGTVLATSFGSGSGDDAVAQSFTDSLSRFRHAVYAAGDFRLHTVDVRGRPVSVALRGKWGFSDEDFVDLVERIVDVERAFFADDDFERFLVTLIPTGTGCCSYGGTGLTNSFATFVASDLPIEGRMKHLLAHELFHTWNGRKIPRQDPEELVYWFSEGFTDYYADLLLFRSGLISFEEYVEVYNRVLRTYHLSPAKNAPNRAVLESFWTDRAVERMPYQRGNLLAHLWEERIRAAGTGASIDDMVRDLFVEARTKQAVVSAETLDRLSRPYLADGLASDIARYVDEGETIPASPKALGPCARLESRAIGPFVLGFDEEATDRAGAIAGVVRGGPAHRAGARDGMKLRRSAWSTDPTRPVTLTVLDGAKERVIEYLPQGARVAVPQYVVDARAYAADRARCEAPLRAVPARAGVANRP
jgi:predicted metalloprotease with PDZ domain